MRIEHRWAPRQPATVPVSLACRTIGLLRGWLRNVSKGGALVQVSTQLPPHAPVEVILPIYPGPSQRLCRLSAIVARCGDDGVGLMFDRVEPEAWLALLAHLAAETPGEREQPGSGTGGLSARVRR